jgi:plastocyanin
VRYRGGLVAALLLAGCVGTPPPQSETPPAAIEVTIRTAPGDRLAFEPAEPTVRATGPISLNFQNGSSLPHNMTFTAGVEAGTRTIVRPGTSDQILLAPPPPGAYPFVCTIHDGMAGKLIVEPASAHE